jgi:hypothetical protein
MSATEVIRAIESAFCGVTLEGGTSLKQARVADRYGEGVTDEQFAALPLTENVDDWRKLSVSDFEPDPCVAHFDAEGLRYYLPALMISVLQDYNPSSMRVIGTLSSLYPKRDAWPYHMERYKLLNDAQRRAIAVFVQALPTLVSLNTEDSTRMRRALEYYWKRWLPLVIASDT